MGLETIPLYFWQDEIESLKHKKAIKLCEEKWVEAKAVDRQAVFPL